MLCVKKDYERHIDACKIDCSSDPILLNQTDLLKISTSVKQDCHTTLWHPYRKRERETVYCGPFHIQVQTAIIHIPSTINTCERQIFIINIMIMIIYVFPLSCWLWSSNPTQTQMPASLLIANFKKLHYHPHHPITPGECGMGLWLHSP
jgi:hypothetical protein